MNFYCLLVAFFLVVFSQQVACFRFHQKIGTVQQRNFQQSLHLALAGKGFGGTRKSITDESGNVAAVAKMEDFLPPTRSGTHRPLKGSYSTVLSQRCATFEQMRYDPNRTSFTIHDVYARLKGSETCWFIGKIAHHHNFTSAEAFASLHVLLREYSKTLRPVELGGPKAGGKEIELWSAPGNTEMQAVQNKINLTKIEVSQTTIPAPYTSIGYEPEVYQSNEVGFRIRRDAQGLPLETAFEVDLRDKAPDGPSDNSLQSIDITETIQKV